MKGMMNNKHRRWSLFTCLSFHMLVNYCLDDFHLLNIVMG
jgi:hypothetical protein